MKPPTPCFISALLLVAACSRCVAEGQTTQAVKPGAVAGGTVSNPPTSGDATVDAILDRLESRGASIKGLRCRILYRYVTVEPVEDISEKEGELLFSRSEPDSRFLIVFRKLKSAGIVRETGEYFSFDGQWLVERNDKARTIVRRQIARSGETKDPFRLGSGPFPLPFGQKRGDILKNFRVTKGEFQLGDPRNSDPLRCVPLPDSELSKDYARVDLYVDRSLELPVRIVTERLKDGNRIEVDFRDIDTREAPAASRFHIEEPKDYQVTVEPLPDRGQTAGETQR